MQAQDIMTKDVVTIGPGTPVKDIARLMIEHRFSGLPVVDHSGHLIGMVTDGDLFRRAELGTEKRRTGWLDLFVASAERADDYTQAHGRTARDIMTTDVIAVAPRTSLRQIADLFETRRIRRVPVVANGQVVGIISRANLVQALAAEPAEAAERLDDLQIRDLILAKYNNFPWGIRHERNLIVTDGVVHLWGFVASAAELDALRVAAEAIPGVKGFVDHTVRAFGDVGVRLSHRSKVTVVKPEDAT